jgi:hypothetical protein
LVDGQLLFAAFAPLQKDLDNRKVFTPEVGKHKIFLRLGIGLKKVSKKVAAFVTGRHFCI